MSYFTQNSNLKHFSAIIHKTQNVSDQFKLILARVETKHRIARNLARIARKFTRSTKMEIEMLEKKIAQFLLDRKKIEKFMLEIARIETQCSKCSLEDRSQNIIRKYRKYLHFFSCENEKNMCFSYFWSKCVQNSSNWLKLLVTVSSALSCSKNAWFCSKNARFCSKIFSKINARDR